MYHINITPAGWGMKGEPDVIACINGRFVAFEFKVGENDMQDDQKIKRARILKSGGGHYCPRSYEEFEDIVRKLQESEGEGCNSTK